MANADVMCWGAWMKPSLSQPIWAYTVMAKCQCCALSLSRQLYYDDTVASLLAFQRLAEEFRLIIDGAHP